MAKTGRTWNRWIKKACSKNYTSDENSSASMIFLLWVHHRYVILLCLRPLWSTRKNRLQSSNELHTRYLWGIIILMIYVVILLRWKAKVETVMVVDRNIQWGWPIILILNYIIFRRVHSHIPSGEDWRKWDHIRPFLNCSIPRCTIISHSLVHSKTVPTFRK